MYKMQDFGLLACRAQGLDLDYSLRLVGSSIESHGLGFRVSLLGSEFRV